MQTKHRRHLASIPRSIPHTFTCLPAFLFLSPLSRRRFKSFSLPLSSLLWIQSGVGLFLPSSFLTSRVQAAVSESDFAILTDMEKADTFARRRGERARARERERERERETSLQKTA